MPSINSATSALHCGKFELCRKGHRLKLERKPLELLVLLVTKHGQVVTREEIAQCLWEREVFVDIEHGINTAIRKIRQILGDSSDLPIYVQTISGSGYRFIATVTAVEPDVTEPAQFSEVPVEDLPAPSGVDPSPATPPVPEIVTAPDDLFCAALPVPISCRPLNPGIDFGWSPLCAPPSSLPSRYSPSAPIRWLPASSIETVALAIGSIAVLPLQNLSGDPGQEYFADGMTDELITELARIPNLRVVSRTSVMANKGSRRPLPEIARQLGVDAIVEGSIVRSGERIRITAQLIDARTDRHLWAQSFEGPASDVLSLQDSVAQQIATQARLVLAPPSPRPPVNPAAHDAYLRGRYFFNKQDFASQHRVLPAGRCARPRLRLRLRRLRLRARCRHDLQHWRARTAHAQSHRRCRSAPSSSTPRTAKPTPSSAAFKPFTSGTGLQPSRTSTAASPSIQATPLLNSSTPSTSTL